MPKHNLNFGRWLERLGLKTGIAPDLLSIIQPTMQVADATDVVSKLFAPSGAIGGSVAAVALNFGAIKIRSPVPVRLRMQLPSASVEIGLGAGPAFSASIPLLPQAFDQSQTAFQLNAEVGSTLVAPTLDMPIFTGFGHVLIPELWCPAGGFIIFRGAIIAQAFDGWGTFYETPVQPSP